MNIVTTLCIIIATSNFILGMYALLVNRKGRLCISFFHLCSILSLLVFSYGMALSAPNEEIYWIWHEINEIFFVFSPIVILRFYLVLTNGQRFLDKQWMHTLIFTPSIFFVLAIVRSDGTLLFEEVIRIQTRWYGIRNMNSYWYWAFVIYLVSYLVLSTYIIYKWGKRTKLKRERKQARFLTVFTSVIVILTTVPFIIPFEINLIQVATPILILWWITGIGYSIAKYALMELTPEIATDKIVSALDLMILIDSKGKIIRVNKRTAELFQYKEEDLLGKTINQVIENKNILNVLLGRVKVNMDVRSNYEVIFITKEGKRVPVSASLSVLRDKFDDTLGFIIVGQDMRQIKKLKREIARRKNIEEELKKSKEKYQIFFDMCPDWIFMINLDGSSLIEVNPAVLKSFNLTLDDVKDNFNRFITDDSISQLRKAYLKLLRGEEIRGLELSILNSLNERVDLEINSTPILENGKVVKILNIARDITARNRNRELKQEMEEKTRLLEEIRKYSNLKKEFVSNISHELRTPLNIILGTVQLFDMYLNTCLIKGDKDKLRKQLNVMRKNCYRLMRLLNNIIEITQIDAGQYSIDKVNCDIVNLVRNVTLQVEDNFKNKGRQFRFKTEVEEKVIACDPDKITRVILNLLSNAIKFTEDGDSIRVNIDASHSGVMISVEDTGIGIPEEKKKIIFQSFRQADNLLTRNNEGGGIGLSIVKAIIEMHGGSISVESTYNIGTKFTIILPNKVLDKEDLVFDKTQIVDDFMSKIDIEFSDIIL